MIERSSTPSCSIWTLLGAEEHPVRSSFGMGPLGVGWPSDWDIGKLGYGHSPEKLDKGLACGRGNVGGKNGPVEAMSAGLGRHVIEMRED